MNTGPTLGAPRPVAIAQRPALLPTWSPLARALAVYTGCALAGAALVLLLAVASAVQAVGLGLVLAVACTGVPVASFVAGHLVLGRWGRPVLGGGPPPSRFVPLGFVICALLSPSLYCAYVLLFRFLAPVGGAAVRCPVGNAPPDDIGRGWNAMGVIGAGWHPWRSTEDRGGARNGRVDLLGPNVVGRRAGEVA